MQPTRQILSVLAISAYLAAALLPCEIPEGLREVVTVSHAAPLARPHVESHAHHDHGAPVEADRQHHDASAAPPHVESSAARERAPELSFKAKCLCGCDETRSMVGGGASRLGPAIPGRFVSLDVASDVSDAPLGTTEALVSVFVPSDPIPI